MRKNWYFAVLFLSLSIVSCASWENRGSPLPGYLSPVYHLLLTSNDFPEGWDLGSDISDNIKSPATNHVGVEWLYKTGDGLVIQSIWRSYSTSEAESYFNELKESGRGNTPLRTLSPNIEYKKFAPPSEIQYRSSVADQFYISCGVLENDYCITLAQYRNYVVLLNTELKGKTGDFVQTGGLTYEEIEKLIQSMDKKFSEFMSAYP